MKKRILLSFLTLTALLTSSAQTTVPAIITGSQVWDSSGSPYLIKQTTLIDTGAFVKVMPGVVIETDSTGPQLLYIDGAFQILGSASSPVQASLVSFVYREAAQDYNDSLQSGAYIRHLIYWGTGSTSMRGIETSGTDLRVENSELNDLFYGISSRSSISPYTVEILSCIFNTTTYGYPIYSTNSYGYIQVHDCQINGGSIYLYGGVSFNNNEVYDFERLYCYNFSGFYAECNTFRRAAYALEVRKTSTNTTAPTIFKNNTIDSIGYRYPLTYPMLKFYSYPTYINPAYVHFNGNNFLYADSNQYKLAIEGYNGTMTTSDSLDFSGNYWGTTDSASIASYIKDYNDDISIFATAVWTGPMPTANTSCEGDVLNILDLGVGMDLEVFPNPATGTVNLRFDLSQTSSVEYRILDMNGRMLLQESSVGSTGSNQHRLDLSTLSSGYFLLELRCQQGTIRKRIVKL